MTSFAIAAAALALVFATAAFSIVRLARAFGGVFAVVVVSHVSIVLALLSVILCGLLI